MPACNQCVPNSPNSPYHYAYRAALIILSPLLSPHFISSFLSPHFYLLFFLSRPLFPLSPGRSCLLPESRCFVIIPKVRSSCPTRYYPWHPRLLPKFPKRSRLSERNFGQARTTYTGPHWHPAIAIEQQGVVWAPQGHTPTQ